MQKALEMVFSYWIDVSDPDGFRIDTLKHVEYDFWSHLGPLLLEPMPNEGEKKISSSLAEVFDRKR